VGSNGAMGCNVEGEGDAEAHWLPVVGLEYPQPPQKSRGCRLERRRLRQSTSHLQRPSRQVRETRDGATNLDVGKRHSLSGPFALASPEPLRCLPTHKHQACKLLWPSFINSEIGVLEF
jgi:hypothetical protein